jgi:hypothetical protein
MIISTYNNYVDSIIKNWENKNPEENILFPLVENLPTVNYKFDIKLLDRPCPWKIKTTVDVVGHLGRIDRTDLSVPIIIHRHKENNKYIDSIFDGVHRYCKAWMQNKKTIPVKIIDDDLASHFFQERKKQYGY